MNIYIRWIAVIALLLPCSVAFAETTDVTDEDLQNLELFTGVLTEIRRSYVDEVEMKELMYGAIKGMLTTLDPHTAFMTPDDYTERKIDTRGEFGGLGIEISIRENRLIIVSPIEDTPAFRAGLQAGDHIVKIEGRSTQDMSISDAVGLMRGKKGELITITVMRDFFDRPEEITIVRDTIKLKSVKARLLASGYAVFRISQFQERTAAELEKKIKKITKENGSDLKGIILDLRNNPGGLLDEAVAVSDIFLETELIVYTKGRDSESRVDFLAEVNGKDPGASMVILLNGGSASASEIVAGALKDNGRAIVVGTKSFGKGSVQTLMPLEDGSGLSLTTALYYTPSGRSIQARGINPDIVVEQAPVAAEKNRRVRESDLKNHFDPHTDKEAEQTELDEKTRNDSQLLHALQILQGADLLTKINTSPESEGQGVDSE